MNEGIRATRLVQIWDSCHGPYIPPGRGPSSFSLGLYMKKTMIHTRKIDTCSFLGPEIIEKVHSCSLLSQHIEIWHICYVLAAKLSELNETIWMFQCHSGKASWHLGLLNFFSIFIIGPLKHGFLSKYWNLVYILRMT